MPSTPERFERSCLTASFLQEPITPDALARKVRDARRGSKSGGEPPPDRSAITPKLEWRRTGNQKQTVTLDANVADATPASV
jgi:hypothetical protein